MVVVGKKKEEAQGEKPEAGNLRRGELSRRRRPDGRPSGRVCLWRKLATGFSWVKHVAT
jgi:hypothetical protein